MSIAVQALTIHKIYIIIKLIKPAKARRASESSNWRVTLILDIVTLMKRSFSKQATTHAQQVALLQQRGMHISDVAQAEVCLQHLNYYRLRAYWIPFEIDRVTHSFQPGTCFDDVLTLYNFDRELRLLILDSIERIEVSVRSQWAYQIGHLHGSHGHLDKTLFDSRYWQNNIDTLTKEVARSDETFIRHLQDKYSEKLPPVWAVCEVMSIGLLSRWYASLKPKKTRSVIASPYRVDEQVLQSWLRHLTTVRNICAHHSRLWNREFTVTPTLPVSRLIEITQQFVPNSRKIYNTLVILTYFLDVISPQHYWRSRLKTLLNTYKVPVAAMDFPQGWEQQNFWQ
jgi:abortive infection bacteriophage resistance protein